MGHIYQDRYDDFLCSFYCFLSNMSTRCLLSHHVGHLMRFPLEQRVGLETNSPSSPLDQLLSYDSLLHLRTLNTWPS